MGRRINGNGNGNVLLARLCACVFGNIRLVNLRILLVALVTQSQNFKNIDFQFMHFNAIVLLLQLNRNYLESDH